MQSRISLDNWQKVSGLGIYQSILNRAVLQICKLDIFPLSHVALPILALFVQSWTLKKWLVVLWNSRMF